ncbi:hypothetical protein FACS1894166_11240 [Bacilli bacterium]|nr:hypothetical protein FACS1894166_11240 [Bacilli bacterium]
MSNKKKTLYTDQKKKKRKLLLIGIIVGAIGLCAGLGGLGYGIYYITNKKPNPVNPTDLALNTANFDMANHDGEIVANQPVT